MNSFRSRGLLTGFAIVFSALLVSTSVSYLNLRRLHEHNQWVSHTHEILTELKQLEAVVLEAESGMRGYLLSGDEGHLRLVEQGPQTVSDSLNRMRRQTADNPEKAAILRDLTQRVETRMALVRGFVDTAKREGLDAGRDRVAQGEGKAAMEALRAQALAMERSEERLLGAREAEASIVYWTAVISSVISGALGLLLAAVGFVLAQREVTARAQESKDLEVANEQLEQRVRERTAAISDANEQLREEIAEREQAEKKVRLFAEELQRSNRELEQFAAVASHDLQEPLRKIQAFGDRLQNVVRGELNEKAQDYLDRMLASAGRMRTLIDGLLQYARVATRHQPAAAVDLGQVARDVVSDLEGRLQQSQGRVEINGLPTVTADPLQMRQLLQNLIGNALKFHRPGVPPEVRISGQVSPAPLAASDDTQLGLQCELVVEDNGVGFEPVYKDRIFELFQRLHGRDEFEGTGMGLAICKKIVERHGGKITAVGTPGAGSRFHVTLPVVHANLGE